MPIIVVILFLGNILLRVFTNKNKTVLNTKTIIRPHNIFKFSLNKNYVGTIKICIKTIVVHLNAQSNFDH